MGNVYVNWCDRKTCEGCSKIDTCHFGELYKEELKTEELYRQMQLSEIKPGRKVRHRKSGKMETIISLFKSKEGGTWHDAVLYQGIDRETGKMAMFGRTLQDFLENFEPVDGIIIGDDLPFTSEGEPFSAKGNTRRNCKNCRNLTPVDG